MVPWWLQRAPFVAFLLLASIGRRMVDTLLVWPVLLLLHYTGLRPRPRIVRTPDERFENLSGYKFEPHYAQIGELRMHYVDEGPADATEVVLCLHGEPSWSYLYRKMIKPLSAAGCRVIAPDFIGFGRSDKYTSMGDYTHALHTSTLRQLITQLDLRNITLVVQDWGGLTGLSVLPSIEDRVARLVIMNTGLPPSGRLSKRSQCNFLTWRAIVMACGQYLPVGRIFKAACTTSIYQISDKAIAGYEAPFPSSLYKAGPAKWPLLVPLSKSMTVAADMLSARDFLKTWSRPALIMFSDKCFVSRGLDTFFMHLIPWCRENADDCHITIRGADHFLQEEVGEALAMHTHNFMLAFPYS